MGTLFLNQIKKQASSFLQEKLKNARLALTDVSPAELLAEEATNNDPLGPDAKTMTKIAEASYGVDYWRIVDVLHRRFDNNDWKEWRQSYNTLVLLEFLLTHGPEEFAEEFQCESYIIEELGTFQYVDERGFNWGANMQKRAENILQLLDGGETLKDARYKALKITKEIQGFGNLSSSPCSSTSPSSATSESSRASSFGSYSPTSSTFNETLSFTKEDLDNCEMYDHKTTTSPKSSKELEGSHVWDCCRIQEMGSLIDSEDDENGEEEKVDGFVNGVCSKLVGTSQSRKFQGEKELFRSMSEVRRLIKKKYDRQFSMGY